MRGQNIYAALLQVATVSLLLPSSAAAAAALPLVSALDTAANPVPAPPGLTYLYRLNIKIGPANEVGTGPKGTRLVMPILSGAFSGPRLNGTLLPLGGDWALVDDHGTLYVDVRQTLQTDDGARIQVFETGSTQNDGYSHVGLDFETGSQQYYWLNRVVGVGVLRKMTASDLVIDAWQMTSPLIAP